MNFYLTFFKKSRILRNDCLTGLKKETPQSTEVFCRALAITKIKFTHKSLFSQVIGLQKYFFRRYDFEIY